MNWRIEGKTPQGKPGRLTLVTGPETEDGVVEHLKGSHPGFVAETFTQLNSELKPLHPEPAPEPKRTDSAVAAKPRAPRPVPDVTDDK